MKSDDLVRAFWRTVPARVAEATDSWLEVERGDRQALVSLRRLLHTIKGESHMLGLEDCAMLFERTEQVADAVSAAEKWPETVGDALLGALEWFGLVGAADGEVPAGTLPDVLANLAQARDVLAGRQAPPVAPAPVVDPQAAHRAAREGHLAIEPVQAIVTEMQRLGGERALLVERVARLSRELRSSRRTRSRQELIDLARTLGNMAADLAANDFAVGRLSSDLDDLVHRASVVPLSRLEGQIHRVARGLAQALDKKVDVTVLGDAMLDAALERRVAPALLQLVRNALDHGIEDPEERRAAGKPERGRLLVQLSSSPGAVQVVVEDDGRGIAIDALRAKLSAARPDQQWTDARVLAAVFQHGVTSRDEAGPVSGRGVGLDVVAAEVTSIGGRVRAESKPGQGARFVLEMPATLRVDEALPVQAGVVRCALPSRVVREVARIERLEERAGAPEVVHRAAAKEEDAPPQEERLVVASLERVLYGLGPVPAVGQPIVIVDVMAGAFALAVGGLDAPRAMAAQPAHELAFHAPLVAGVAPAADGGVVLLLDAMELWKEITRGGAA